MEIQIKNTQIYMGVIKNIGCKQLVLSLNPPFQGDSDPTQQMVIGFYIYSLKKSLLLCSIYVSHISYELLQVTYLKKFKDMSDDIKQMMTHMMKQMQQQQKMIANLNKQLAQQKNRKNTQQSNYNPTHHYAQDFSPKVRSSSISTKGNSSKSSNARCPQNHFSYKPFSTQNFCNKCSSQRDGGKKCTQCNFFICIKCEKVKHDQLLCQSRKFKVYRSEELCLSCGYQRQGGRVCDFCKFKVCRTCEKLRHQDFCSKGKWQYYSSEKFCLGCGYQTQGGLQCQNCGFNLCQKCAH